MRPIKLEIRINNLLLRDQFMWDINNPSNSPEAFASTLIADLGLGSEFFLPIAHSIREQIHSHWLIVQQEGHHKSLPEVTPKVAGEADPQTIFRSPVGLENSIVVSYHSHEQESAALLWSPTIQQLTEEDVRKYEKQEERNARYARRNR